MIDGIGGVMQQKYAIKQNNIINHSHITQITIKSVIYVSPKEEN